MAIVTVEYGEVYDAEREESLTLSQRACTDCGAWFREGALGNALADSHQCDGTLARDSFAGGFYGRVWDTCDCEPCRAFVRQYGPVGGKPIKERITP